MKRKYTAWSGLRQNVEQVVRKFKLYENFNQVNITEIDNIDKKFQKAFIKLNVNRLFKLLDMGETKR